MTIERAAEIIRQSLDMSEWGVSDQIEAMVLFFAYAEALEPIVEKYDVSKGFKLFGRMDL